MTRQLTIESMFKGSVKKGGNIKTRQIKQTTLSFQSKEKQNENSKSEEPEGNESIKAHAPTVEKKNTKTTKPYRSTDSMSNKHSQNFSNEAENKSGKRKKNENSGVDASVEDGNKNRERKTIKEKVTKKVMPGKEEENDDDGLVDTDEEKSRNGKSSASENMNNRSFKKSKIVKSDTTINSFEKKETGANEIIHSPSERHFSANDSSSNISVEAKSRNINVKSTTNNPNKDFSGDEDFHASNDEFEGDEIDDIVTEKGVRKDENIKKATKAKRKTSSMEKEVHKTLIIKLDDIPWKKGDRVPYSALCDTFARIEEISGRLEIQEHLTRLFQKVIMTTPADLIVLVYLGSNSVAPAHDCVELGIGDSILEKAIGESSGAQPSVIKQKYKAVGDLGTVAQMARAKQKTLMFAAKPKPLPAFEVLSTFRQIATTSGAKSQKWKVDIIKGLLVRAQGQEAKFIIRGLQGKLRIGLAQSTVLISLAKAVFLNNPDTIQPISKTELSNITSGKADVTYSDDAIKVCNPNIETTQRLECAVNIVKRAYSEVPSYDVLLKAALSLPLCKLHHGCGFHPGVPVSPMLAKPTKSVQEVLKRLNGLLFTCEYKYDGERAQVHMTSDGVTKVFSRSLLDTSEKYPEVPIYVKESFAHASVNSFVLDTEVVAYNRETKQFVPFQVLSTRKKAEESAETAKVQVIVQAFDLMYLNGDSLLDKTLAERRNLMKKHFNPVDGKFQYAKYLDHKENGDTTVIEEFLDAAVKGQCEGLMIKTLDVNSNYEPSRRSLNWLKLKKDYLEGLGDSVDLVPIGAFHGRGKRTGVYGAYLLACYDPDTEEFQSVCKIGTGFSEDDLQSLAKGLNESIREDRSSQYNVSDALKCDVWFDPVQVWEIKAADLSKSSIHKGAIDKTGDVGRGIGLRFPRFERIRCDKQPDDATTSDQILEMYYAQDTIVTNDLDENDGI